MRLFASIYQSPCFDNSTLLIEGSKLLAFIFPFRHIVRVLQVSDGLKSPLAAELEAQINAARTKARADVKEEVSRIYLPLIHLMSTGEGGFQSISSAIWVTKGNRPLLFAFLAGIRHFKAGLDFWGVIFRAFRRQGRGMVCFISRVPFREWCLLVGICQRNQRGLFITLGNIANFLRHRDQQHTKTRNYIILVASH